MLKWKARAAGTNERFCGAKSKQIKKRNPFYIHPLFCSFVGAARSFLVSFRLERPLRTREG